MSKKNNTKLKNAKPSELVQAEAKEKQITASQQIPPRCKNKKSRERQNSRLLVL